VSKIALSYDIPFVERVTMPAHWARWLADRGGKNPALKNEQECNGTVRWEYAKQGLAPWMQFFYDWRFADLVGDGLPDLVISGGARRQIAYLQNGELLWSYQDDTAGFTDIRLDSNFPVVDVDGDGRVELICARKIGGLLSLCVVNAQDGSVKNRVPYPDVEYRPRDCRGSILVANVSGRETPSDIVVSWDYGSIAVYDTALQLLWKRVLQHEQGRRHTTMGHTPHVADIDGDGRDEIMAGSCLLNHNGETLWVAPDLPALVADGHADSVQIVCLSDTGNPNVVMSTGAYCFSAEGKLLWGRDELKHGQAQHVGKIRADVPGKQVIVYEGTSRVVANLPDRVLALTKAGELLWDFEVVQPDMQEGGFGFWLGDWNGDGLDEVFVNDQHKVNILDGHGNVVDTIPGHLIYVFDLVGDGRVEAVILTGIEPGMKLQIVANDRSNPYPKTNQEVRRRHTTKAMYNCTRY
jgi:hypothetical protein